MPKQVEIRDVSVMFNTPDSAPTSGSLRAVGPVSFDIDAGQFVTLVGPSGCGKSTLIRVLAGLQPATRGTVYLDGEVVLEPSPRVGMMFQNANLMPWRTVMDNIALPLELAGTAKGERYDIVRRLIPTLGLAGFETALPGELSGGMAQRTALGRILVQSPDVLLLDEPFGALDAITRETVSLDLLRIWAEQKQTVLMVTHDINEAVFLADRVLVMSRRPGQIIADIAVALPRPRRLDQIYQESFAQVARQVRAAINSA